MATERPRPVLQNELVVAHDDRHSYMQRMHSLAGPGAYKIPSTFQHRTPNLLLRMVQRENYGREFARQNRITATSADTAESPPTAPCQLTLANTHRARREQLRKTLQADRWCQDDNVTSPSPSKSGHRASRESSPRATSPNDRAQRSPSPSSRASSPGRLRWTSADLADIVADFGEPAEMDELLSEDAPPHAAEGKADYLGVVCRGGGTCVFLSTDVVWMLPVVLFDVAAALHIQRAADVPAVPREHELSGAAQEAPAAPAAAARGQPIAEECFSKGVDMCIATQ